MHLQGLVGRSRRILTPEEIDEAIGRLHFIRVEEKDCEEGARLTSRDLQRASGSNYVEGAEYSKLHAWSDVRSQRPLATEGSFRGTTSDEGPLTVMKWRGDVALPSVC